MEDMSRLGPPFVTAEGWLIALPGWQLFCVRSFCEHHIAAMHHITLYAVYKPRASITALSG